MNTWEYLTVTIDEGGNYTLVPDPDSNNWKSIVDLGREGWELVCIGWFRGSEATAIFKRNLSMK